MGEVYKARDTHLDRFVAIKVLRPDAVADQERTRRFVQEAKAASALNHPNIVTIHDIARAGEVDYIVMEYLAGRTLDQLIGRSGLPLGDLLQYAIQASDALAKAHAAGIVHRDLKPANIMVTGDGRVKILDFGLAKLAPAAESSDTAETTIRQDPARTGEGWVVGTPAYMSPEQAEGKPVDARSDIFSFGAVLYEMATGASAFRNESAASTLAAVLTATPPPPSQAAPHLPRELERVIVRCLRKEPSRRYQLMADLTVELEDIKTESGERIEAARAAPVSRRKWWWVAAIPAAALVVAAGVWWRWPAAAVAGPSAIVPLTSYQGREIMPSLSPDGTQVAFVWNGERQDNWDIFVKPLDAVTPLRLTSDPLVDVGPAWSPSGREIAFVRRDAEDRRALYVTPLIPGSERKVADLGPGAVPPSWTPDGAWLVVDALGPADGENGLFLVPVESGDRRPIVTAPIATVRYAAPAVSPSGSDVAYVGCTPGGGCDVWLQPLGASYTRRGDPRRLTEFSGQVTGLTWMPDGRSLVAGITTSQGSLLYLWRVPISGTAPTRLDWAGSSVFSPSVSQSGRRLAAARDISSADIWQFDLSSPGTPGAIHPISSTLADVDPELSPDGTKIVFASTRSGQEQEIWIARSDGSGLVQLTRRASGRNRGSPRWSNDGTRIAFDTSSGDGVRRAYVVDATGGEPRLVSDGHGYFPSWSPDDRWIYFTSNRSGSVEIWRVPSDGGAPEQVTTEGGTAPRISSDGRTLYYRRATTLYAKPVAGGPERPVVQGVAGISSAYLPFGNDLFYLARPDASPSAALEIRATDVTTSMTRTISRFEATSGSGLTVSPNGTTVLLGVVRTGSDLMLVENFQ